MKKFSIKKVKSFLIAFTRHCLQVFIPGSNRWSVVVNEHKIEKDDNQQWISELNFYIGNLQTKNIDWKTDCRFCEIKDKRKQVNMIGFCRTKFLVRYPLWLTNGTIIEDGDYYR